MPFRRFLILFLLLMLAALPALADTPTFEYVPQIIYPGKAERIAFSLSEAADITLSVRGAAGETVALIRSNYHAAAGVTNVTFSGQGSDGAALPQGEYTLCLQTSEDEITHSFTVGAEAPRIILAQVLGASSDVALSLQTNMAGTLNVLMLSPDGSASLLLSDHPLQAGSNQVQLPQINVHASGTYTFSLTMTNEAGISGNSFQCAAQLTAPATPTPQPTLKPLPTVRPSADATETIPGDYWSMELGNYDWEAIWQVMIAPMTIITGSGKEAEKQTYKLRATPNKSSDASNVVGMITCQTQGVHVLETLDSGWTYIEAYNSSYGEQYRKNGVKAGYGNTGELIRGYVETSRLDTFTPRTEYGILIDKMTQELYIVTENGLLSTLLVSTGYATSAQPWNETPAGEFYLSSKVGDFDSGNLKCRMGMRFNNGDILHQVPGIYNEKYDIYDYATCERYLGEKASHGCIRVQRKVNDEGINMEWIYNNVPIRTKLLIWEDSGRPLDYPVPLDTPLYYNPTGGKYYHADPNCPSVANRYLPLKGELTYGELDDYKHLSPCKRCNPPEQSPGEIDAINAKYGF